MTTKIIKNTTSAIFLLIVLVAGTFTAISPSFITVVNAQQYGMDQKYNSYERDYGMDRYDDKQSYGKDNSYDKSKDSSSNVKCNNININLNGFNGNDIGTDSTSGLGALATDDEVQATDEGEIGASSFGSGSGGSDDGRSLGSDNNSRFVCINNNNNKIVEGEEPPTPPTTPPTATLSVKKTVTCTSFSNFPQTVQACETILNTILPSSFNIVVTGNNPKPSEFAGSTVPVVVTLGAGDYRVTESAVAPPVIPGIFIIQEENFAGNCIEDGFDSLSAIGTIAAGEFQTCDISNDFTARLFD